MRLSLKLSLWGLIIGASVFSSAAALAVPGATLTVNSTGDTNTRDSTLTLREAIFLATGSLSVSALTSGECAQVSNSTFTPPCSTTDSIGAGAEDTAVFDAATFPSGTPATITLSSSLFLSTGGDTVSGAGAGVIVDGVTSSFICLIIPAAPSHNNTVAGLHIRRCSVGVTIGNGSTGNVIGGSTPAERNVIGPNGDGISITSSGSTGNFIRGNYIGIDPSGTVDLGNTSNGVLISDAGSNFVGGTGSGDGNVISGNNANGVRITGSATFNIIQGNLIGTNASGTAAVPNSADGVRVDSGASANNVGGTTAGARNVISGNGGDGVEVSGSVSGFNNVQGNYIGTDITGTSAVPNVADGVRVSANAPETTIGGSTAGARNVISGNGSDGIEQNAGTAGSLIQGNYIGTNAAGTAAVPNGVAGVNVAGASSVRIGGTSGGDGNLISGNIGHGIRILGSSNVVQRNLVGVSVTADSVIPNGGDGVRLENGSVSNTIGGSSGGVGNLIGGNTSDGIEAGTGTGNIIAANDVGTNFLGGTGLGNGASGINLNGTSSATIGGTSVASRNRISGNGLHGVLIAGSGAAGNIVLGNYIGINPGGVAAIANAQDGVRIEGGASFNTIGGTSAGARNVISGNGAGGVRFVGSTTTGNSVLGNYIGTNAAGTATLGNLGSGVVAEDAPSNDIGGTAAGAGNVISGNLNGIIIDGVPATGNSIEGNYIGTNAAGTADLGNFSSGVHVIDAPSNVIGGTVAGARNVISGNNGTAGVHIFGATASGNVVQGNYIGTNAAGTSAIGNGGHGVLLNGAPSNVVGGASEASRNVVSGNSTGVRLQGAASTGNSVQGNYIGTDAAGVADVGNGYGVYIFSDASANTIGGTGAGEGNLIAFNDLGGVYIFSGTGNTIDPNLIHSNSGLGIDLEPAGPTPNDVNDADTGPNNVQNYPVLDTAFFAAGNTAVEGSLNSAASTTFLIEFFANTACDPSGFGEGETFAGSALVTTTGNDATISETLTGPLVGDFLTATATNQATGDTSEFSACREVDVDPDGDGIGNLTDNCPDTANPGQENTVHPGTPLGDHCEDPEPDGVFDITDNCPDTANPGQENQDGDPYGDACEQPWCTTIPNAWSVPDDDGDCDGWPSTLTQLTRGPESFIGTVAATKCAGTPALNDEAGPDAWPVDFNDSQSANLVDVLQYIGKLNYSAPNPLYNQRFDLSGDGAVNLIDVLKFIPFLNKSCT